jgi:hypothetical protein
MENTLYMEERNSLWGDKESDLDKLKDRIRHGRRSRIAIVNF